MSAPTSQVSPKRSRPEVTDGRQYIEEKGEEKIIKNSPYGTKRQAYGWGTPFTKPLKAVSKLYPSVFIGCSSLNGAPSKDRAMEKLLQQYQKKFRCLEHCAPYHRMGDVEQWEKWGALAGKNFTYTIKCNQYLTHMKLLEVDADTTAHIKNFFEDRIPKLGSSFGAALVQLPPTFRFSDDHLQRIKSVAALIPGHLRIAIEFRHSSWYNDRTYEVLRAIKWAMVATHVPDVGVSPVIDTGAGFMYVRLHGAVELYSGDYGIPVMQTWASHVQRFIAANGADSPVYFFLNNNESHSGGLTSSIVDATALAECLDLPALATVVEMPPPAATAAVATPAPTTAPAQGDDTEDEVIEVDGK